MGGAHPHDGLSCYEKHNLLTFVPKSKTKPISYILAENYGIHTPIS